LRAAKKGIKTQRGINLDVVNKKKKKEKGVFPKWTESPRRVLKKNKREN